MTKFRVRYSTDLYVCHNKDVTFVWKEKWSDFRCTWLILPVETAASQQKGGSVAVHNQPQSADRCICFSVSALLPPSLFISFHFYSFTLCSVCVRAVTDLRAELTTENEARQIVWHRFLCTSDIWSVLSWSMTEALKWLRPHPGVAVRVCLAVCMRVCVCVGVCALLFPLLSDPVIPCVQCSDGRSAVWRGRPRSRQRQILRILQASLQQNGKTGDSLKRLQTNITTQDEEIKELQSSQRPHDENVSSLSHPKPSLSAPCTADMTVTP